MPPLSRALLRRRWVALIFGGLLITAAGCAPAPTVVVLAPTDTPAGAIVPTRALTQAPRATLPAQASATPAAPSAQIAGETLALSVPVVTAGSTRSGAITARNPWIIYPLQGNPGAWLDLTLDGNGGLQPFLIVLDPDGRENARSASSPDPSEAAIRGVELTGDGTHYVVATRQGGRDGLSEGDYALTISPGSPDIRAGVFSQSTAYETIETGAMTAEQPVQSYTFSGRAGDRITAQATALSEGLDTRLELRDALGNLLAANDDDPRGNTFESAIYDFTLPANAVYTVDVASFGGTLGDFRLKLTQDGQADLTSFRLPRLNVLNSGSLRDDQVFVTDYRAGDQLTADGGERRVQTLLTFELPPERPSGVATLELRDCSQGGTGFAGLGLLAIYDEDYGALQSAQDLTQPGTGARLLTELSACGPVDVTEAVASAYSAGRTNIQFRLAFSTANNNGQTDEVRFVPRLQVNFAG